jgi:hypothetical protein
MTTPQGTPQDKLRALLTRELDGMQDRHALTYEHPSGRGIASAFLDTWHWLDIPGMTWEELTRRVSGARAEAVSAHAASAGNEDFWAYARADGFSGVQGWIRDLLSCPRP